MPFDFGFPKRYKNINWVGEFDNRKQYLMVFNKLCLYQILAASPLAFCFWKKIVTQENSLKPPQDQ